MLILVGDMRGEAREFDQWNDLGALGQSACEVWVHEPRVQSQWHSRLIGCCVQLVEEALQCMKYHDDRNLVLRVHDSGVLECVEDAIYGGVNSIVVVFVAVLIVDCNIANHGFFLLWTRVASRTSRLLYHQPGIVSRMIMDAIYLRIVGFLTRFASVL